ncbi:c-type cytochrome [Ancylobacter oerskovii]|uniref:C-type cytochrome n=1 Tax=Ancylobacter oerskovii TaxID=459519 RepID=A0ABW4Z5B4_9HYPH|nr:c-type cytochrome [Ancylobacter oerskovii]MBS7543791.1 c-type cytochrome [Ancylobacter oerskovii]
MRLMLLLLPALWVAMPMAPAEAAPPRGATSCTGCHPRTAGRGPIPSLNGRSSEQIVSQMTAFRSGERTSTVMTRIAKGFSDEEIRAIADYFAAGGNAPAGSAAPAQP